MWRSDVLAVQVTVDHEKIENAALKAYLYFVAKERKWKDSWFSPRQMWEKNPITESIENKQFWKETISKMKVDFDLLSFETFS